MNLACKEGSDMVLLNEKPKVVAGRRQTKVFYYF